MNTNDIIVLVAVLFNALILSLVCTLLYRHQHLICCCFHSAARNDHTSIVGAEVEHVGDTPDGRIVWANAVVTKKDAGFVPIAAVVSVNAASMEEGFADEAHPDEPESSDGIAPRAPLYH